MFNIYLFLGYSSLFSFSLLVCIFSSIIFSYSLFFSYFYFLIFNFTFLTLFFINFSPIIQKEWYNFKNEFSKNLVKHFWQIFFLTIFCIFCYRPNMIDNLKYNNSIKYRYVFFYADSDPHSFIDGISAKYYFFFND